MQRHIKFLGFGAILYTALRSAVPHAMELREIGSNFDPERQNSRDKNESHNSSLPFCQSLYDRYIYRGHTSRKDTLMHK